LLVLCFAAVLLAHWPQAEERREALAPAIA
jgi:hypothetical protein